MTIIIRDQVEREREEEQRRFYHEMQKQRVQEPKIVLETTCPTCGQKRYVAAPEG